MSGSKLHVERRGQHLGGQFFGVFAGLLLGFAKTVMLAQVAVGVAVGRNGYANARNEQAVRFAGGVLGDDCENDFAVIEIFEAFLARDDSAPGGKMDDTRTRFCDAMPASRRASSNEVKRSLCLPTPLVKKSFFGTMFFPNFYVPSVG